MSEVAEDFTEETEVVIEPTQENVETKNEEVSMEDEQDENKTEIDEMPREVFLKQLLEENFNDETFEQYNQIAEKYNLTNSDIEKYNRIVSDIEIENGKKEVELAQDSEESMILELNKLSENERNEVKGVYEFWDNKLPNEMKSFFDKNFQTAEGFRGMKFMMETASQSLPDITDRNQPKVEFTVEDFSKISNEIRKATDSMDFDGARTLKAKMISEIKSRGTAQLKKDLANFL